MTKKNKISKEISKYLFLNNLEKENVKTEVGRIFRFIINKNKIETFLREKEDSNND